MLPKALNYLAGVQRIDYKAFLQVHRILFQDLYPWAGQDRALTMPDRAVIKDAVVFCSPRDCERAVTHGLRLAQEDGLMTTQPGRIMGMFAYGHPFLDGNGRTMLLVHAELCFRAAISVDWSRTDKDHYLRALTREIAEPQVGHLDAYLRPFIAPAIARTQWLATVADLRGLDGTTTTPVEHAPRYADPEVVALQRQFDQRRNYDIDL
ncbi:Fic family protein [Castellaniella sp.]|uniref:Fic family protein n=1 Tax=Castellaniella sp. TaxID=1955812 RepID=UPI003A92D2D9